MQKCLDCGSTNIVETEDFAAYFREGDMLRQRMICVYRNINSEPESYIAYCSELSKTASAIGDSRMEAIKNLGEILKGMLHVELLGKTLELGG